MILFCKMGLAFSTLKVLLLAFCSIKNSEQLFLSQNQTFNQMEENFFYSPEIYYLMYFPLR